MAAAQETLGELLREEEGIEKVIASRRPERIFQSGRDVV
jgi:hypothetical protein